MKTFSQIKALAEAPIRKEILEIVEHCGSDGQSFRLHGAPSKFGRAGYGDPHHLSGRGQLLDVLIRKISQLGVENDDLAQEVAEKLGLDLGPDGGVQKLLKALKCNALGLTVGDLPTDAEKAEVLDAASQLAASDFAEYEERPFAPEAQEIKRAPKASRTPPNQGTGIAGDPLGYSNQGNLDLNDIRERFRRFEHDFLSEGITSPMFSRQKGKDHIKLFSGKVEAFKRRDGLWTDYDEVKMPTTFNVDVWWDSSGLEFGEDYILLDVHVRSPKYDGFSNTGLIYTDGSFERGVRDLANRAGFPGKEVAYTDQGMQGRDWVSMEGGRVFARELAARFPDVFRKEVSDFRESVELKEDKTDKELKRGLEQWIKDARDARRAGNRTLATQIRRMIMQVVNSKGLDAQRIMDMLDEGCDPGFTARISLDEDITPTLRNIVARKTAAQVQFDNKKRRTIDLFTASAVIAVHDALKPANQEKFRRMLAKNEMEFDRAVAFAFKHVG